MRILLAHWHQGHPPGAEIDVDDVAYAALRRDGRVAAVVEVAPATPTSDTTDAVEVDEAVQDEPTPDGPAPAGPGDEPPAKPRRGRRR